MRSTLYEPIPIDPDSQGLLFHAATLARKWMPVVWLLIPFVAGLLVGVAFTWIIKRRGWRARVISVGPISIMFGTLAYVVAPGLVFVALTDFWPRTVLTGLAISLFYTWPIWLVMGPVLFVYISCLKKREKWLKDSTVTYLSAFSLMSECAFISWFMH